MKRSVILRSVILISFLLLLTLPISSAGEPVIVKIATSPPYTKGSPMVEFTVKFQELAGVYSEGLVEVQIFWGGQLGTEQKVFKDAQEGVIQGVVGNIANLAPFSKILYAVTLPYLFDSREQAYELFRGDLGDYFTEKTVEKAGIRVIAWPDQGSRVLHNTQKSVQQPEDARGLKWRVPNNPVFIKMYESWGINPIPMAWAEVFSSLQTGVIHGGDNVLRNLIDFKMYEFEKYVTLTNHMLEIVPLSISERWFQKQDKTVQDALTKAARDAWEWQFAAMGEDLNTTKQQLSEKGMVIVEPTDRSAWQAAQNIWPDFYDKMGGKEVLDEVLSYIK